MRIASAALRLVFPALVLLSLPGCSDEDAPDAREPLLQVFPERAGEVIAHGEPLVAGGDGFALETPAGAGGLQALLPRRGDGAIRLRTRWGLEVSVREVGAHGEGRIVDRSVAYERAGGTSFWSIAPGGVEHWMHLDAGPRAGVPAGVWEVEGASVVEHPHAIALVDAAGVAQIWVTAPRAYGRDGRALAPRLEGGDGRIALFVDGAEGEAVLVDPVWTTAAPMATPHAYHEATLLLDGRVLITGGVPSLFAITADAEIYDPATNAWTVVAPMTFARRLHAAARLPDGRVLVTGGEIPGSQPNSFMYTATTEIYDPAANTWTAAAPMPNAISFHAVTPLPDGRLLVSGGYNNYSVATASLYDPATGAWSAAAPLTIARHGHTATLLPNGKVLAAGGRYDASELSSAQLYDPATNTWAFVDFMSTVHDGHTATLLPNGRVLVVSGPLLPTAETWDPVADAWTATPPLATPRRYHTATLLGNGRTLVAGGKDNSGYPLQSGELYDAAAGAWFPALQMGTKRAFHTATLLPNGEVLMVGGENGGYLVSAERYGIGALGDVCAATTECASGLCVDGVCCDTACTGLCEACSAAKKGSGPNGTCGFVALDTDLDAECAMQPSSTCGTTGSCDGAGACELYPNGGFCNDGNECTVAETCLNGACGNGQNDPDGSPCDDGNGCTTTDTCQSGACTGADPVMCLAFDECHDPGVCDSASGLCSNPIKPNGTPCSIGTCQAGICTPESTTGGGGGAGGAGGAGGEAGAASGGGGAGGDAGATSAGGGGAGGAGGGGTGGAPGGSGEDDGCGCRAAGADGGDGRGAAAAAALALLAMAARPRRRRA